jgi:hypothetical protein
MNTGSLEDRWVTIKEAAAVWGISTRAVQKRVASGSVKTRKEGNRRYVLIANTEVRTSSLEVVEAQLALTKEALERTEAERDRWYQQAQDLTEQNGRFQFIIARLEQALPARSDIPIDTQFAQVEEEAEEEPVVSSAAVEEEEAPPGRGKWWQLWRR